MDILIFGLLAIYFGTTAKYVSNMSFSFGRIHKLNSEGIVFTIAVFNPSDKSSVIKAIGGKVVAESESGEQELGTFSNENVVIVPTGRSEIELRVLPSLGLALFVMNVILAGKKSSIKAIGAINADGAVNSINIPFSI
jgi:hypothetical protein